MKISFSDRSDIIIWSNINIGQTGRSIFARTIDHTRTKQTLSIQFKHLVDNCQRYQQSTSQLKLTVVIV